MKLQKFLWIVALIFVLMIVSKKQKEEKERLEDGNYENCYMISLKEEKMEVLVEGKRWTISCPVGKTEEMTERIVDMVVENNCITKIIWKEGQVSDVVLAVNQEEGWIVLKNLGRKNLSETGKMYIKDETGVRMMTKAGSLLNWNEVSLFVQKDEIQAIVALGEQNKQEIKVLLHGEQDGIYHNEVRLTASETYQVIQNGETKTYEPGQEFHLAGEEGEYEIRCENGKIRMLSFTHTSGYPEYRGIVRISTDDIGYVILNELPLEEYLYSVVSSEMPSSYPNEALKAQAVCARTYALYQMERAYYSAYGAHVDDTVNSQVYNNVAETEASIQAVETTKGQYLEYDGAAIPAYFYSTSCGMTSDVNDVWIDDEESPVYLQGHFQGEGTKNLDLSQEEDFLTFLKMEADFYEKEEDWFRWTGKTTLESLSSHINKKVKEIGTITEIQVVERSGGGVLKEVKITGEKGSVRIKGEYQIRKALCVEDMELSLQNEETMVCSMLPSGYFYVEIKKKKVVFTGGGYGHGVGLSQNGAKAMADLNHDYEAILLFYYPKTTLLQKY